ncbi:hypothetical protein J6590_042511 [Homalodisca vitripennis]|nr:hypothetical protein J6590_042511 [Homalodisca vitripennis]
MFDSLQSVRCGFRGWFKSINSRRKITKHESDSLLDFVSPHVRFASECHEADRGFRDYVPDAACLAGDGERGKEGVLSAGVAGGTSGVTSTAGSAFELTAETDNTM